MPIAVKQEIGQLFMLLTRDFQQRLDARGITGISARHRSVFLHLGRFGPCRSVDLAEAAGIRPQSMMKIIHELEQSGWLQRQPDPSDSRAKLIDFTEKGHALIRELGVSTELVWNHYAELLGADYLQQIQKSLGLLLGETPKAQPQGDSK